VKHDWVADAYGALIGWHLKTVLGMQSCTMVARVLM
jgi:hypothetical protein